MFVKIDGVTSAEDARLAAEAGADAVGVIFGPSPRRVSVDQARAIVGALPPTVIPLGVFVDEPVATILDVVEAVGLRAVQLHGREPAADARWLRARVPFVLRAFAAGDPLLASAAEHGVDAVVVDHPRGGGAGEPHDWATAARVAPPDVRVIIAGGLTPANVADAIAGARPWGVDVSSGVESSPGRKDAEKLRAFVANARRRGRDRER